MPPGATEQALSKHAQSFLLDAGVAVVPLTQSFAATLETASKAFQGQLQCWASKPPTAEYTGFQRFSTKRRAEFRLKHNTLTRIGVLQPMAEELALKLNAPCTLFDRLLQGVSSAAAAASSLEAIQYLGAAERGASAAGGCEAHVDKGLLTCIFADSPQGLQVQAHGQWRAVIIPAGHVAILPGYTLERASCGLIKATSHMVKSPDKSRTALIYKLRASDNAVLNLYSELKRHHTDIPLRLQGPIAVSELMYFFDATHASVNDPARAERLESVHSYRSLKRVKLEQEAAVPPAAPTPQPPTQPAQQQQAQAINVAVESMDGVRQHFKIFARNSMRKLVSAYANVKHLELHQLKFIYDGELVDIDRTLQSYAMRDGDVIHCLFTMRGD